MPPLPKKAKTGTPQKVPKQNSKCVAAPKSIKSKTGTPQATSKCVAAPKSIKSKRDEILKTRNGTPATACMGIVILTFIPYHINFFTVNHSPSVDETGSGSPGMGVVILHIHTLPH
jgi:hypothetical protein